ncbi:MAG: hypothetical protein ACRERX_00080, partial [Pseudomonas sp.]
TAFHVGSSLAVHAQHCGENDEVVDTALNAMAASVPSREKPYTAGPASLPGCIFTKGGRIVGAVWGGENAIGTFVHRLWAMRKQVDLCLRGKKGTDLFFKPDGLKNKSVPFGLFFQY